MRLAELRRTFLASASAAPLIGAAPAAQRVSGLERLSYPIRFRGLRIRELPSKVASEGAPTRDRHGNDSRNPRASG